MSISTEHTLLQSYLSFGLNEEVFAVKVFKVKEILQLAKITKVPHSPAYMVGVLNLRGSVLPVIDARIKFGFEKKEATVESCIIVINIEFDGQPIPVGALVDSVYEVFEVTEEQILVSPQLGSKYKPEFIEGLVKSDDAFIMLLNIDEIFSSEELALVRETSN